MSLPNKYYVSARRNIINKYEAAQQYGRELAHAELFLAKLLRYVPLYTTKHRAHTNARRRRSTRNVRLLAICLQGNPKYINEVEMFVARLVHGKCYVLFSIYT